MRDRTRALPLTITVCVLLLSGCGQTGPLVLPGAVPPPGQEAPPPRTGDTADQDDQSEADDEEAQR